MKNTSSASNMPPPHKSAKRNVLSNPFANSASLARGLRMFFYGYVVIVVLTAILVETFPHQLVALGCILVSMLYTFFALITIERQLRLLPMIKSALDAMKNGDFEPRITKIGMSSELADIAWSVNEVFDQLEVVLYEYTNSSKFAHQQKPFRQANTAGLNGNFAMSAAEVGVLFKRAQEASGTLAKYQKYLRSNVLHIADMLESVLNRDLSKRLYIPEQGGDVAKLIANLNQTVAGLQNIVQQFRDFAGTIGSASTDIMQSAKDLFGTLKTQSAHLSEIAPVTIQMTSMVSRHSADIAQAADLTKETVRRAKEGRRVVEETVDGMEQIAQVVRETVGVIEQLGTASEQIDIIVRTIEEIAEQTNLLALNAAIEAARAGEFGKGFAVVADEVRRLAERTQKSTKEIAKTIKVIQQNTTDAVEASREGVEQVNNGINIAQNAGQSLAQIVAGITQVNDIISQIASAFTNQLSASERVSGRLEEITLESTKHTKAAGEVNNFAHNLFEESERLQLLAESFILDENYDMTNPQHLAAAARRLLR